MSKAALDIAIIGMAGRFPDARSIDQLNDNLMSGKDSLRDISPARVQDTALPEHAAFRVGGYLEGIDKFDHQFFNIPLSEAKTMDPHQRFLMETVHHTFDNAGYNIDDIKDSDTSIFIADASLQYYEHADRFVPTLKTGNVKAFVGAQITKFFELNGASVMVDTSCSSSLMAVHMACQDLLTGDSELALACGANMDLFPYTEEVASLDLDSPDGKSRPFSAQANGMSFGEASVCVLLKPLNKALEDKDVIHAIIKGSAVNNNAGKASSLTSPDYSTLSSVIKKCWRKAGISPDHIEFLEAHGSGTQLGDSIEVAGINDAFAQFTDRKKFCVMSTVKTNIGHTRGAAGISGLIRAILTLKNKRFFPAIHFEKPSPFIDFENSAVWVNRTSTEWKKPTDHPRYAAVNSIGLSGTNVHMLLEEPPEFQQEHTSGNHLFLMSGLDETTLQQNLEVLKSHIDKDYTGDLNDVSYTLARGRRHLPYRYSAIAESREDLILKLEEALGQDKFGSQARPKVIVLLADHDQPVEDSLLETLQCFETFREAYHVCIMEGKSEGVEMSLLRDFGFQFATYKLLSEFGFPLENVLSTGKGKILIQVLKEKISLTQGIRQLCTYKSVEEENMDQRIVEMILKQQTEAGLMYLDLGNQSTMSDYILKHENVANAPLYVDRMKDSLDELLQKMYVRGFDLNWNRIVPKASGKRVPLPGYVFNQIRCWIRETPKQSTIEDQATSHPVVEDASPLEHQIIEIWQNVLKHHSFTISDSFFQIGGDSLMATQVIHELNRSLSIRIDFEDFFDFDSIKSMAAFIEENLSIEDRIEMIWNDVLGTTHLQETDNFFKLGGHSLLANQVLNRLREEMGLQFDFEDFFRNPTLGEFSLMVRRCVEGINESSSEFTIEKAPEKPYYAVSYGQKRLWILSQQADMSRAYNQQEVYRLSGHLDVELFEKAVHALIERHESLRTVFVEVDGEPKQRILSMTESGFELKLIRLRNTSETDQELQDLIAHEAHEVFDLSKGPLLKTILLELAEDNFILIFNMHHIVSDGWSGGIVVEEIRAFYESGLQGNEPDLDALPIQYKDYAEWQHSAAFEEILKADAEYWKDVYKIPVEPLKLPLDYNRPAVKTGNGDRKYFTVDGKTYQDLRAMCEQQEVTTFMLLTATLNVLFYHYSRQRDIVIGTPVAGRDHKDLEGQIGFYVNTLALRVYFSPSEDFISLLAKTKEVVLGAFKHQMYPFDQLVSDLGGNRDLSRSPLFDVMFVLQNTMLSDEGTSLGPVTISDFEDGNYFSRHDLLIDAREKNSSIAFHIDYNTDLFSTETIERIISTYQTVLKEVLKHTSKPLKQLNLMSDEERFHLINNFQPNGARPERLTVAEKP